MEKRFVYADNSATTPVYPEVLEAMMPAFGELYGNPSSLYSKGREAKRIVDASRERIAEVLGCKPTEFFFTSCGTESDNWAIKGAARANVSRGKHLVTTKIEHHAVLHTMRALEKEGFEVTYVSPDKDGIISPESIVAALREDTTLVAVMYANNEIGTIEPIREITEAVKAYDKRILVFTDAVQALGNVKINIHELGVDMLSLSGHKIHAPKGIGGLYIRTGARVHTFVDGGGQERSRRGGTENVAYIAGLAKAIELADKNLADVPRIEKMRDRLVKGIVEKIPYTRVNGTFEHRLAGNVNVAFEFIEGESMLLLLDRAGIASSTGSACSSNSLEPSHVLLSIGVPVEVAHGSLRLSLGRDNTEEDVDYILEVLPGIVQRLRDMSPIYPGK
ncbi:MAG: cysteine desulfurase NifS [Clostridia bacterium]|nr:cysteine desulfurase NifS [Clostridia bacterium]